MSSYKQPVQIRWSDLDPNFHLRHSVYYDWGAQCRIDYLIANGITPQLMAQLHIGPILFREECVFRKEIRLGDEVTIDIQVTKAKRDFSRWTILHQIKKGEVLSANLTVEIAWMDTMKRKLTALPEEVITLIGNNLPKAENFEWLD